MDIARPIRVFLFVQLGLLFFATASDAGEPGQYKLATHGHYHLLLNTKSGELYISQLEGTEYLMKYYENNKWVAKKPGEWIRILSPVKPTVDGKIGRYDISIVDRKRSEIDRSDHGVFFVDTTTGQFYSKRLELPILFSSRADMWKKHSIPADLQ